jgi:hypothetical protein
MDERKTNPDIYQQKFLEALQQDGHTPQPDPSFWALVICSHWKQPFVL